MSRSKYDNEKKSFVIDSGLVPQVIAKKKELYFDRLKYDFDDEGIQYHYLDDSEWYDFHITRFSDSDLDCAFCLYESKRKKMIRVRQHIENVVLNNNAVFITLTFRDDVLKTTSPQTRRRYVARYLKSQGLEYVANIDFSPDIEREHYHAVICSRVDLKAWKYGFASAEKVRAHKGDMERLTKYITKLTNHALKVDITRLIYSRL